MSDLYLQMLKGEISSKEYARRLKQQVRRHRQVNAPRVPPEKRSETLRRATSPFDMEAWRRTERGRR